MLKLISIKLPFLKSAYPLADLFSFLGLTLVIFSIPFNHTKSIELIGIAIALIGWTYNRLSNGTSPIKENPLFFPICIFLGAIILSFFSCLDFEYSIKNLYREFIPYTILFFVASDLSSKKDNLYLLVWIFIISNILCNIVYFFQFFVNNFDLINFLKSFAKGEYLSIGKSHGATYFLFASIFSYTALFLTNRLKEYFLISALTLSNFFMLFVTDQRGALVGLASALVSHFIFFKFDRKKLLLISISVSVCSIIFILSTPMKTKLIHEDWSKIIKLDFSKDYTEGNDTTQIRVFGIKYFLGYLKEYPLTGVGYGRKNIKKIEERFASVEKFDIADAHNVFINMAVFLGLQGLVAFIYLVFIQFKIVWNANRIAAGKFESYFLKATLLYMIGFFVRIQFTDMYRHGSVFNYWIIIGMAIGLFYQYRAKEKGSKINQTGMRI